MTGIPAKEKDTRLIDSIEHAEQVSLKAVRSFVESVDNAFPIWAVTTPPAVGSSIRPSR